MNIDYKNIEKTVVEKFSVAIEEGNANTNNVMGVELTKTIASIAARVTTIYLEELERVKEQN